MQSHAMPSKDKLSENPLIAENITKLKSIYDSLQKIIPQISKYCEATSCEEQHDAQNLLVLHNMLEHYQSTLQQRLEDLYDCQLRWKNTGDTNQHWVQLMKTISSLVDENFNKINEKLKYLNQSKQLAAEKEALLKITSPQKQIYSDLIKFNLLKSGKVLAVGTAATAAAAFAMYHLKK